MLACSIFPSAAQKVFRQQLPQRYDNERVGWKIFNKFSNRFFLVELLMSADTIVRHHPSKIILFYFSDIA